MKRNDSDGETLYELATMTTAVNACFLIEAEETASSVGLGSSLFAKTVGVWDLEQSAQVDGAVFYRVLGILARHAWVEVGCRVIGREEH